MCTSVCPTNKHVNMYVRVNACIYTDRNICSDDTYYQWPKKNQVAGSQKNVLLAFISSACEF